MNESEPTIITKIRSSLLLVSGCRFKIAADKEIELTDEFITVPIDKGKETIIVSLSFKHVNRIELLDNRECKGAGMVLYINDFMATKLQCVLDENGTKLLDYKTPYSPDKFIVLDILNSDIRNLNRINNILYKAGMFHHSYLVKQMNSRKKAKIDIPFEFLSIISHCQWVAALSLSGIDPGKIEPVQFVHENGCRVVTLLPNKKPKIKVQNFDQQMSVLEYIRLNQLQPVTTEKQTSKQKQTKHEIHLLDDDDTEETKPCVSKDENEIVLSFPPNSKDTCSVHYSDLKYLAIDVMLNDTIIDFYLKYIHHSIIPIERRDNIFIFTTFFFARLTQAPAHGKQQVTMATKLKRVNSNFQSLRNWTKKVDIFAKDYIVVPINEDIHWYLAIIVKPRAAIYSTLTKKPVMESGKPFVVVFNSLIDPALDKHIEVRNQLAEYLYLEFKDKYLNKSPSNGDKCFVKEALQVIQPPLIPQQKGYIDCGLFLLHFAELFLTKPPKTINDKTSFRRWFPDFQIRDKRHQIKEVIRILSPKIKNSDFIYYPPLRSSNNPKRSKRQQPSALEALQLVRRERKQSDTVIDEIQKDSRFSVLYRPRSLDSLIKENKEKPLVLQPPTIFEMKRYKKQKM